ncbi:MAG: SH3 domain-containing protein [Bacteroidales bacterium]|nr:SH3 domain-containing protein [Bacteroidales bacterium]
MQKIRYIFTILLLISVRLYSEDPVHKEIEGLDFDFYFNYFGSWDLESQSSLEGEPLGFSWGKGEYVRYLSLVFDYNFLTDETPKDLLMQGEFGGYFIDVIHKIGNSTYKLTLRSKFDDSAGIIIMHMLENDKIWFETEDQYLYSIGKSTEIPPQYGTRAYDNGEMYTGSNWIYVRRSGPKKTSFKWGVLNTSNVRVRCNSTLDSTIIGSLSQGDEVQILDQTEFPMKVENTEALWYKIRTSSGLEGWSFGHFIDIDNDVNLETK